MKISFKKLYKKDLIIYDFLSYKFAKKIFNCDYEIYYNRFEYINFYIFLKTIFKFDYSAKKITYNNFKDFYKKLFFQTVNPKIVYTAIDNNPGFYKLKNIFPKAIYISDQNGMRNEDFFNYAKKFKKLNRYKLKCDISFLFGKDYLDKIKNVIESKKIIGGNTLNNSYPIKFFKKKKKTILYILGGLNLNHFNDDLLVIKNLRKFCIKNNFKLILLSRPKLNIKKKLIKNFDKVDFEIIETKDKIESYEQIHKYSIVVFHHSTLGFEALSRGIKCVFFGANYFKQLKKLGKRGPFWSPNTYKDMEKKILKVYRYNKTQWKKIYMFYSNKILIFDLNNKIKYKIINSIIKSKKL